MADTEKPTKKYRGNCHCAAFVFEIELPEIRSARECNCSICVKKGYMWVVTENRPTIVRGEDALVGYRFASKTMEHHVSRRPPQPGAWVLPGTPGGLTGPGN